jgi:hypothetical protein
MSKSNVISYTITFRKLLSSDVFPTFIVYKVIHGNHLTKVVEFKIVFTLKYNWTNCLKDVSHGKELLHGKNLLNYQIPL